MLKIRSRYPSLRKVKQYHRIGWLTSGSLLTPVIMLNVGDDDDGVKTDYPDS